MKKIVIMPGGFHPFHAGHYALYQSAVKSFPGADVYVAATNDTSERPFPFAIKEKLAQVAGIPQGHFVQVKSPFGAEEITSRYDPNDTILIFIKSQKNSKSGSDPEGPFPAEVDSTTGKLPLVTRGPRKGLPVSDRLQYLKGNENNLQPMSRHSYLAYLPTVKFGSGIKSGSELRKMWPTLDTEGKTELVMSMYPATQKNERLAVTVVKMIDMGMGSAEQVQTIEGRKMSTKKSVEENFSGAFASVTTPLGATRRRVKEVIAPVTGAGATTPAAKPNPAAMSTLAQGAKTAGGTTASNAMVGTALSKLAAGAQGPALSQQEREAVSGIARGIADADSSEAAKLKAFIKPAVAEGEVQQLSVDQLAAISDEALDSAYHYGRSSPGNTFGWQANLKSAAFAKKIIDAGVTDIEKISDAIHQGWNVTAQAFVKNPMQFDDSKTMAPEKLQAKLAQREKLMTQRYAQLPEDEKEKDRVVARAMLKAITGAQGVAEGVPQPGPSSGAPKQFGPDAKIQTRQMTVKDIISSVPGVPYYNNVVDDWDAKDYSWGVTEKVIEYATYLKDHPESLSKLPPIIVLNGKFEDGAHRVSAIWLLQQRMDPKNPLWKNAKLNVQFVKQGVAEGNLKEFAPGSGGGESGRWYTDDQMTDLVGDGWWNDLDISGEVSKQEMIQEAQAWLDDQGYSVHVLNCKVNDDDMEWFIEGSFQNSNFAKKGMAEGWSQKYKNSINCSHPKGFSQKAHCAGKRKHSESTVMEMTCPDCGMCKSHGSLTEIKKGQKDSNGYTKCWPGHHAEGTKTGKNGGQVRNCVPNERVSEDFRLKADFRKETDAALADFLSRGGEIETVPPNRVRVKPGQSLASKHIGSKRETGRIVGKDRRVHGNKPVVNVSEVNDYFKRRKDEEDRIAGVKPPAKRTPQQTDYQNRRNREKQVGEAKQKPSAQQRFNARLKTKHGIDLDAMERQWAERTKKIEAEIAALREKEKQVSESYYQTNEDWKTTLAGAALAGAAALGGGGAQAQTADFHTPLTQTTVQQTRADYIKKLPQVDSVERTGGSQATVTFNGKEYQGTILQPDDPRPRFGPGTTQARAEAAQLNFRGLGSYVVYFVNDRAYIEMR